MLYGRGQKCLQGFVAKSAVKREFGKLGRSGRVILKWILEEYDGVNGTHLAQNRDQCRVLVNIAYKSQDA
jgi:hypothetical protein